MFRRAILLVNIVIIMTLFVGSGAQWMILQSVAWTNMLIQYSQNASFGEALEKTFDGEHPCPLCKRIQNAEKQTRQEDVTQPVPALKGVLAPRLIASVPDWISLAYSRLESTASPRFQQPPVPPPRLALV